jgi:hypothetical protein
MNLSDLLHKIRTCDKRGNFKYSDVQMLNELITYVQEREASARERALAQAYLDSHRQEFPNPSNKAL